MAWPNGNSFEGPLYTPDSVLFAWMHALCHAINEREALVGVAETQWATTPGFKTRPDLIDFDGTVLTDLGARIHLNTRIMHDAIDALVGSKTIAGPFTGHFVNNEVGYPAVALEDLRDTWTDAKKLDYAESFRQIRDALNILRFLKWDNFTLGSYSEGDRGNAASNDLQTAWNNAVSNIQSTSFSATRDRCLVHATTASGTNGYHIITDVRDSAATAPTQNLSGALVEGFRHFRVNLFAASGTSVLEPYTASYTSDGDNFSFEVGTDSQLDFVFSRGSEWPNIGTASTPPRVRQVSGLPANAPFQPVPVGGGPSIGVDSRYRGLTAVVDVLGELTYG